MASKRDHERAAARAAKRQAGKPALSRYAAKGGPQRYDQGERRSPRRGDR